MFYRKLMSVADDYGRFFSNPISILGACYPLRPSVCEADVKQMLNECITAGLVVIYGGGKYIVILNFGQQTRSKSKFPQPTDNDLLIKCEANVKQMSSLVGVEGGVEGGVVNGVKKDFVVSETMLRLGKLFNRRESTRWDSKELKALKEIEPIPDEDFQAVEKYYTRTIPKESDFRRHDLVTLLNNWNGEVDRARKFKPVRDLNL